ncbi:hypothetical protein V6N13_033109 [Hibiscus sabdariffa]
MDSNKFAFLFVAMAFMLLAATAPTVTASRNDIMPFSIIANANPNACLPYGAICKIYTECCTGRCSPISTSPGYSHCD